MPARADELDVNGTRTWEGEKDSPISLSNQERAVISQVGDAVGGAGFGVLYLFPGPAVVSTAGRA